MMRPINLNPEAFRFEAFKITYPQERQGCRAIFKIEPMKFVPHSGRASK